MEFRSRSNQPQPAARPAGATPTIRPSFEGSDMDNTTSTASRPASFNKGSKPPKKKVVMIAAVIVIVLVLLCAGMYAKRAFFGSEMAIAGGKYQAVFLTNGQVYFGHLSNVDGGYAKLTHIYYLQVQQQVQPEDKKADTSTQPQVSLTKLGNELHGPEDSMYIARDQVLFWENLKDDGKVVQAITDNEKK